MIVIVLILVAMYYVVYTRSREVQVQVRGRSRVIVVACILSSAVFGYAFYQATKPPEVDYYATRWLFAIQNLNARFVSRGLPHMISEPWK